jgi:hypothetical protein
LDGGFCVDPSSIRWEKISGMGSLGDWDFVRNKSLRTIIHTQISMAHPPISFPQAQALYAKTYPLADPLEAYRGRAVIYTGTKTLPEAGKVVR